jgi:hypothetical protein
MNKTNDGAEHHGKRFENMYVVLANAFPLRMKSEVFVAGNNEIWRSATLPPNRYWVSVLRDKGQVIKLTPFPLHT